MGFTIEDMLVISRTKYSMKIIAGKNGWSNSISFLLMLEDDTIIRNFTAITPEEYSTILKNIRRAALREI